LGKKNGIRSRSGSPLLEIFCYHGASAALCSAKLVVYNLAVLRELGMAGRALRTLSCDDNAIPRLGSTLKRSN
jgi:hypothetical protein